MGHSAAAAFQHYPHADIPLHKQCLIALSLQVCARLHVHAFVFSTPATSVVWQQVTSRVLSSRLSGI